MKPIEHPQKVFFVYSMDCERIAEESILKNGSPSWEVSEKAIRGMADVLRQESALSAGVFLPTPATAEKHKALFLELKAEGFDVGCQFHCDSFRSGEYTQSLGLYGYDEQKEIITLAKQDWEAALGLEMKTWRCGFCSANDFTFPILDELGVEQGSSALPGRHVTQHHGCWVGAFPFPHHASRKSRLTCGDLDYYEAPIAIHPYKFGNDAHTSAYDLRPDRGFPIEFYTEFIDRYLEMMLRADPPIKAIVAITHNTIDYLDADNPKRKVMEAQIDHARQVIEAAGYEFAPASFADIHAEADRIGAY